MSRHAVSLEQGDAAGIEELEDLRCDRRGPAHRLAHLVAEQPAHPGEDLLIGLLECALKFGGHGLAPLPAQAHVHAELDRL